MIPRGVRIRSAEAKINELYDVEVLAMLVPDQDIFQFEIVVDVSN